MFQLILPFQLELPFEDRDPARGEGAHRPRLRRNKVRRAPKATEFLPDASPLGCQAGDRD